eukprot:m.362008 g.362008  ORF g.362008 m.362008 type:complete len:240 (-) comp20041_c0_seq1:185-904(-)
MNLSPTGSSFGRSAVSVAPQQQQTSGGDKPTRRKRRARLSRRLQSWATSLRLRKPSPDTKEAAPQPRLVHGGERSHRVVHICKPSRPLTDLEVLAHEGYADAQVQLAKCLGAGEDGYEFDPEQAMEWLERAAIDFHDEACFLLGNAYHSGEGKPVDARKAYEYYGLAAIVGHAEAQYNVGLLYEHGDGIEPSYDTAAYWYSCAAAQGHAIARTKIRFDINTGTPHLIKEDDVDAHETFV